MQEIFKADQSVDRRYFFAQTSPKIQKEIKDEESVAAVEKAKKEAAVAAKAEREREAKLAKEERQRRLYRRQLGELRSFCDQKYTGYPIDFSGTGISDAGFTATAELNVACQQNNVGFWLKYRSRICKAHPQFCKP